jgi:hypothetical protein
LPWVVNDASEVQIPRRFQASPSFDTSTRMFRTATKLKCFEKWKGNVGNNSIRFGQNSISTAFSMEISEESQQSFVLARFDGLLPYFEVVDPNSAPASAS